MAVKTAARTLRHMAANAFSRRMSAVMQLGDEDLLTLPDAPGIPKCWTKSLPNCARQNAAICKWQGGSHGSSRRPFDRDRVWLEVPCRIARGSLQANVSVTGRDQALRTTG